MASVNVASAAVAGGGNPGRGNTIGVDKLPEEMNEMKIRDDSVEPGIAKDMEPSVVDGNGTETGHIIVTIIGGRNGQPKQLDPLQNGDEQLDLIVIGCGSARLSLVAESAKLGLTVGLIGPDMPFTNNYGVWEDEFQATESGNYSRAKALSLTVSGCLKDPSKGLIFVRNTLAQQSKESSEVINPKKSPHSVLENLSVSSAERKPQENVSVAGKDAQKSHGDDEVKSKSKVKKSYPTPSSLGQKHGNSYGNIGSQHSSLPHPTASQSQMWAAPDPRQNVYMIPQGSMPPYGACFMPHGVYGAQGYPLGSPYPVSGVNEDFAKGRARRKMRTNSQTTSSGMASEHGY